MPSRSPTLTLVGVIAVVYVAQVALGAVGIARAFFALSAPLEARPWTLVTSVYAHGSAPHLLANVAALVIVGLYLERRTSPARFHAFFLASGVLAGVAEVLVGGLLGTPVAVLGASGAIFALIGYLLAGNRVADAVLGGVEIDRRWQFLALVAVAGAIALATDGRRVALVAHFTGLLVGLLAGRVHLLRTDAPDRSRDAVARR